MSLNGADVYEGSGPIDVDALDVDFLIMKQSESAGADLYRDHQFPTTWAALGARNVHRQSYHFLRLFQNTGQAEALAAIQVLGSVGGMRPGDIPGIPDLEDDTDPNADLLAGLLAYLDTWERATAIVLPFYSRNGDGYMARHNLIGSAALNRHRLWLASPGEPNPAPVPGFDTTFVQRSWTGRIKGCGADVDLDTFNGTRADLDAMGFAPPKPVDPTPIDPRPTVQVDDKGQAVDVLAACKTISQEALAMYWQLSAGNPTRPDQAGAVMQIKANVDAIIIRSGLLGV